MYHWFHRQLDFPLISLMSLELYCDSFTWQLNREEIHALTYFNISIRYYWLNTQSDACAVHTFLQLRLHFVENAVHYMNLCPILYMLSS